MTRPRVIVIGTPGAPLPPIERLADEADFIVVSTAEELKAAEPGVEILFLNHYRSDLLKTVGPGDLRWIHTSSIGVDALLTEEIVERDVVVTISRGVCERPIAEWVLSVLLLAAKDLRQTLEYQRTATWAHRETLPIQGRRVVVVGPGPVGREIARLLRAVGMTVDLVGRRARQEDGIGGIHALSELDELLAAADDLVLALPLNESTRGMFGAERLALLRPGTNLVNVGRGAVVDEPALLAAAQEGRIGSAALDVFEQEPLPATHPFWAMDNVLVSPHMSGDLVGWRDRVLDRFAENLRRWINDEPLADVVDLRAQLTAAPAATPPAR
jgi:phosphoglycerate dehydrogenase-like enzyme